MSIAYLHDMSNFDDLICYFTGLKIVSLNWLVRTVSTASLSWNNEAPLLSFSDFLSFS